MVLIEEKINDLQNLIKRKVTYDELAPILGVGTANALRNWNYRKRPLKEFEIKKIDEAFNIHSTELNNNKQNEIDDCIDISVRGNLTASLGAGIEIVDEYQTGTYAVSRKLMKDVGANISTTDFVPCEGDSMYPTIEGGALLMVDRSKTEVFDGKIYCIRLNNQLMAKRLQFLPPNKVKVISDNKEKYDAFYVDLSKELEYDFAIIGEVKWYGTVVR